MGRTLRAAGFSEKIEPAHWYGEWRKRMHVQIMGHDRSILEITRGNDYIRIVLLTCGIAPKPFAVYWFCSDRYPERPKTEFHLSTSMPAYMDAARVERVINRIAMEREKHGGYRSRSRDRT